MLGRDCKQESESENIVKYAYLDIFICSKASSIAFASAENIDASSGSQAENTFLLITASAVTFFFILTISVNLNYGVFSLFKFSFFV